MMFESGHCSVTPYGNGLRYGYIGRFGGGGRGSDCGISGDDYGDGDGYGGADGDGIGMPHTFQKSENPYCTCTYSDGDMRYFICQQTMVGL